MAYVPLNYARIAALAALLTACPSNAETGDSTSSTDATTTSGVTDTEPTGTETAGTEPTGTEVTGTEATGTSTGGTDTSTTDIAPTTGDTDPAETSTGEAPAGPFGFACVNLHRGENVDVDPFVGTRKITVTLNYEPCLIDYYTAKHPEMQQDGQDGAVVFTAWESRLCTEDVPGLVACEVEGIEQTLKQSDPESYKSAVTYTVAADAEIDGRTLLWGPAPLPEFAECDGDLKPFVNLSSLTGVVGFDENDVAIWQVQSFGNKRMPIGLSGMGCIDANLAPTDP